MPAPEQKANPQSSSPAPAKELEEPINIHEPAPEPFADKVQDAKPELPKSPAQEPKENTQPPSERKDFSSGDDFWAELLALAEPELDIPPFLYLSDRDNTAAELRGTILNISMKNPFTLMAADTPEVIAVIKKAAQRLTGNAVSVKFTEYSGDHVQVADKLDELARFGNIKFE